MAVGPTLGAGNRRLRTGRSKRPSLIYRYSHRSILGRPGFRQTSRRRRRLRGQGCIFGQRPSLPSECNDVAKGVFNESLIAS